MKQDHVFFDIGTDGVLDDKRSNIYDIAAIRTDGEGNIIALYNDKIEENKISFETACVGLKSVILDKRSPSIVIVCHFAEYVRTVFLHECKAKEIEDPFTGRSWIDTAQLAWPLMYAGLISGRDIESVAKYYGCFNQVGRIESADKVTILAELYWRMMDRFLLAQKVEGGIRRAGGGILGKVISNIR